MLETIREELKKIADAESVRILYAIESGSRAWGFESPDSDYDIRFIYVRPRDAYLTIHKRRDVIEAMLEPDLDFSGWDLPKTLQLLQKSNPSLLEWLGSTIVYGQDEAFMREFRELADRCVSIASCLRHYLHMAEGNWQAYLSDGEEVLLKKYLYVLRPVMACRWIERYNTVPPVPFQDLLAGVSRPGALEEELEDLLKAKAVTSEIGKGPRRPAIDQFLKDEMQRFSAMRLEPRDPAESALLDDFFRKWIAP